MAAKLRTAVLGATGYSGLELTRILVRHPPLEKPVLLRRPSQNGNGAESDSTLDLAETFPALSGNGGYPPMRNVAAARFRTGRAMPEMQVRTAFLPAVHVF